MTSALAAALAALPEKEGQDKAVIELARQYAAAIDANPKLLADLGPKLQAALIELHMTPRARATVRGGKSDGKRSNPLNKLRNEHEERHGQDGAAPMDSPTKGTDS